ncbi:host-nuclease inhibitor Gam family protein [Mahella australiensis]|uniref:Bacteriophage Mu Gam like protein n=1 Tax=Mahella australiensis (strain DSM 15567 / CIP 107919 / 50-1 BON) TaxID=697281 RepID=F3ZXG0_MAHA5|nr:host-nuclease inhibitor Gam family protein [Mahella australiensis]AEE97641.1 hypothetical protein Mahau_2483 [Mahella australiensis 50-1 BON]
MSQDTLTSETLLFPDDETEGNEEWRITNDLTADWAIAKIKAARADLERKERLAAEKIAEVQRWIEGERQKTKHKVKKQQPVFRRDNETLLQWLRNNQPTYIRTKEEPDWASIKEQLAIAGEKAVYRDTGEVVSGIEVEQQPDKFIVE